MKEDGVIKNWGWQAGLREKIVLNVENTQQFVCESELLIKLDFEVFTVSNLDSMVAPAILVYLAHAVRRHHQDHLRRWLKMVPGLMLDPMVLSCFYRL